MSLLGCIYRTPSRTELVAEVIAIIFWNSFPSLISRRDNVRRRMVTWIHIDLGDTLYSFYIAQEWLKSYLKERKQLVQIDECASTLLSVTCGVPQGSILGPKLFIVYINDICNASSILKLILFADDTNVFYSGVDIQTLCECINRELNNLHVWLSVNKLSLNVDKTNYILFGNRKYIDNVCISMNNSIITRVRATQFLGVIIDEKLTWKDHISLVRSKLAKTVGILYRVRHLLNRSALFILYCPLFLPYLT